jgi:hypothetical protein
MDFVNAYNVVFSDISIEQNIIILPDIIK